MFSGRVTNCFDSHVHWLATGEMAEALSLRHLESPHDIAKLEISEHHLRGEWLLGYGWDHNVWRVPEFPHRRILDEVFGSRPVAFIRTDGHALWANTEALKRAGLLSQTVSDPAGGRCLRGENGELTGVFIDTATRLIENHISPRKDTEVQRVLLKGMNIFNRAGFTHIRDLSGNPIQWEQACRLDESDVLTLAVEQFFNVGDDQDFSTALKAALTARKERCKRLRVVGIKAFVDGALGSEGAWLSHDYASGTGHGLKLIEMSDLKDLMSETWSHGLDLAIHTIGDEAAHQTLLVYTALREAGIHGRLHLEHAELLRPDTVKLMANQNIRVHFQPCHWLSDHRWLEEKIGSLTEHAFPWRALQEAGVKFDFGSDSPIERPSIADNLRALEESSTKGIRRLLGDPLAFHSHPDSAWVANTYTIFADGIATEVVFGGEHLI